ncbi:MAG: hypothetical protein A2Z21_01840 [Candidatus Fraserbacteria bacterium RBG_16_55_9]|uniref:Uncharacterized protein n=1 Tax=Fraserbacteria sp. (strain RBG_16_55_9) TaxID=1817864 RepID=A0A1F5UP51_FRAXR|nr:MAG: hypothetical protein A2Z21_01840 [Candidatus Fraserbacteria bacterium RBG_16_55_9]
MATTKEKNEQDDQQSRSIFQREALNNAYAALLGQQNIQTFSAFTFEDALDQQIKRIEGEGTKLRPNLLERTDNIYKSLVAAVEQIRQIPPEDFLDPDSKKDANTVLKEESEVA